MNNGMCKYHYIIIEYDINILPHNDPKLIPEVYILLQSNNIKPKMNI